MRTADGAWAAFTILDAGGDAMRWARRAFHNNEIDYDAVVGMAEAAPSMREASSLGSRAGITRAMFIAR